MYQSITSFEQFNEYLWECCEKDALRLYLPIEELWEADRDSLLKLPGYPFPVFRCKTLLVNKNNLSPTLVGRTV